MTNSLTENNVLYYDQGLTDDYFAPFALTDYFLNLTQERQQPILHFWQLPATFILGMKDARLPNLKDGLQVLKKYQLQPLVRNAGGLGVMNDTGILNISLFLPNPQKQIAIDDAYQVMTSLMQQAFNTSERPIDAYEIVHSYCPGKFDLSIHGLKIAGIAQRRVKEGIAIMLYLSATGNQWQRGNIVREFYQACLKEEFGTQGYPAVDPSSMTNIDLTVATCKEQVLKTLRQLTQKPLDASTLPPLLAKPAIKEILAAKKVQMRQRNADLNQLIQEVYHD